MDEIRIPVLRDGKIDDKYQLIFIEIRVRDPREKAIVWHPIDMLLDTGATRTLLPNPKLRTARNDKPPLPLAWLASDERIKVRSSTSVRYSPKLRIRFRLPPFEREFDADVGFMPGPDDISPELMRKNMERSVRRAVAQSLPAPFAYGVLSLQDVLKHFNISIDDSGTEVPFVATLRYRTGGHKCVDQ